MSLLIISGFFVANPALAAARTASVSGNWNSTTTWGGLSVPVAGDAVTINAGVNVTINTTATCTSITWPGTMASPSTITISGTNSLTVSGATTMALPSVGGTKTIAVGAGTFTTGTLIMGGTSGGSRLTTVSLSTGTINITGATFSTAGVDSRLIFTGSGTLNTKGTFMSGTKGTFTSSTGTVNLNATAGQTVGLANAAYIFNNLTFSGSGAKTFPNGTTTVNGIFSREGTATVTLTGTIAYGAAATLQYKGTGAQTTGGEFPATWSGSGGVIIANTSGNAVTLNATKVINAQLNINSGAKLNLSTFTSTSTILTLGGVNKASGTWGGTGSGATHINTTYFAATTGKLNVATGPTPSFSNITSSQIITYGVTSITLGGTVSASGPIYPADGETVSVTINGETQSATIAGGVGGFSLIFSTDSIPASASPYTITYTYAGSDNLNPAASDTSTTLTVEADLTAYNETLAAVTETDYTVASWAAYQVIVDANVVTVANTQAEVDIATGNILTAQGDLTLKADLTAYNETLAAVTEENYTTASWEIYQEVVAANEVTVEDTQDAVDAATDNITAAQGALVEIAELSSIEITTPADKLSYIVGDALDITGLVVTGHYSDDSIQVEIITADNVSGFDSSAPMAGQILTITVGGETTTYTIDIIVLISSDKDIISFVFPDLGSGVIIGNDITVEVPFGTDITILVPNIEITGASVSPLSGETQNFTGSVDYTVTAEDNTTQAYTVTVTVAADSAKDITSFDFVDLTPNVTGFIVGTDISLDVPFETDVTALIPTIIITGTSVNPVSGVAQDFTSPVTYTVTAADNSTQDYTVTVIVAEPSDLTALTAAITEAQSKYDAAVEGSLPGEYPAPLKADLQTAINIASAITNTSVQSVVDDAVTTLNDAVTTFEAGIVLDTTPPVITLGGISVMNIYMGSTYVDAGATASDNVDGNITANISSVNPVNPAVVGAYTITYDVSDIAGNSAAQVIRTVNVLAVSSSAQLFSENTTVSESTPEILIGDNDTDDSIITIPDSVTNATINVSALSTSTATSTTATIQGAMTINASTTIGAVNVEIPADIQITAGTSTWNGIINVPQVKLNSTVTVTPDSGNTAAVFSVVEIGYGDTKLTFSKAVRLLFSGQAGKEVGYSRGGVFTKIDTVCSVDTQAVGDALPPEGDCKISIGSDLIIWTKHFTNFVTYTQTTIPASVVGGGGGGGGGGYVYNLTIGADSVRVSKIEGNSVTIIWTTSDFSTSQVIYDTIPGKFDLAAGSPKYGFAYSKEGDDSGLEKATGHSVTITGLLPNTTYYYRTVSIGSFIVSQESSFTTPEMTIEERAEEVAFSPEIGPSGGEQLLQKEEAVPTEEGTQQSSGQTTTTEQAVSTEQAAGKEKTKQVSNVGFLAAIGLMPFSGKFILILVIIIGLVLAAVRFIGKKKK